MKVSAGPSQLNPGDIGLLPKIKRMARLRNTPKLPNGLSHLIVKALYPDGIFLDRN